MPSPFIAIGVSSRYYSTIAGSSQCPSFFHRSIGSQVRIVIKNWQNCSRLITPSACMQHAALILNTTIDTAPVQDNIHQQVLYHTLTYNKTDATAIHHRR
jgi:hypothetical protein